MRCKKKLFSKNKKGFTFIEVMIALVIFYTGIVAIFRSYIYLVDKMGYLTDRLYATIMIDNRIEDIERMLRAYKVFPSEFEKTDAVNVGPKKIYFKTQMKINEVDELFDVFKVDLTLSWKQSDKTIKISRSAFISDTLFPE